MTGTRVWWYFVAFFGLIAAVNAGMVTLALRTHSGLVTEHPYEKGLAYNKVVSAQLAQEKLGWKASIDYKDGVLFFALHDKNNQPIPDLKATATITRPTQAGLDFMLEIKNAETPLKFPADGLWEVRINVEHKGVHYQQSKRIVVQ